MLSSNSRLGIQIDNTFKLLRTRERRKRRLLGMSDAPQQALPTASDPNVAAYSGPSLETIKSIVASQFQVKDAFLDPYEIPTILVSTELTKEKFKNVVEQLRPQGLLGAIRRTGDTLTIKVFQKPHVRPSRRKMNLWMFLITIVTLVYAGYFVWSGALFGITASNPLADQLNQIISPGASAYLEAATFAMGLLAIIGLHEFGHKAATNYHRVDASFPYFIPGPPPIGTFGALISLKSPPANRDQLFDLGLSGPVIGFIVTIAVAALSVFTGVLPNASQATQLDTWNNTCLAQLGVQSCFSNIDFGLIARQPLILIIISQVTSMIRPGVLLDSQLFF